MTIKIDHEIAKKNLLDAYQCVIDQNLAEECTRWKGNIDHIGRVCPYRKSSTFIAALGTAILAKTVNIDIDPYSLLDREGSARSYSARSLADNVWAKNRARLGIDLGANGANPLNNLPFIGRDNIRSIEQVRNREGKTLLFKYLNELDHIDDYEDAKSALRGFIASRIKKAHKKIVIGERAGDHLVLQTLANIIEEFTSADSEEGRRAQGVAAGLLMAGFGAANVDFGHINDPDRNHPLDITVFSNKDQDIVRFSVEVKDKKIHTSDIMNSIEKISKFKLSNILYLAIGKNQNILEVTQEAEIARDLGCKLIVFFSWEEFCKMCLGASKLSGEDVFCFSFKAIGDSLVKIGVSNKAISQWIDYSCT